MVELMFDARNPYWSNDKQYNLLLLRSKEAYFNDILGSHRFVSLYDVITSLGYYIEDLESRIQFAYGDKLIGWYYPEKIIFDLEFRDDGSVIIKINAKQPYENPSDPMVESAKNIHEYCKKNNNCDSCPFVRPGFDNNGDPKNTCLFTITNNPVEWRF